MVLERVCEVALAHDEQIIRWELVLGHLQIQRGRSLADSARRIVMGTVARTIVATPFTGICNWHASQMSADTNHHQPLGFLDTLLKEI